MFGSLSTSATDYKLLEESMDELWPLSAQLCTLIVRGEINFLSFHLFERWHKNYHFHNLPAIIVTRYFTSHYTCSLLLDFLVLFFLDDDPFRWTGWTSSRSYFAFFLNCLWSRWRIFQICKFLVC